MLGVRFERFEMKLFIFVGKTTLMKQFTLLSLFFMSLYGFTQPAAYQHFDTLFFQSGMLRPCTIDTFKQPTLFYEWTNAKGKRVKSTVSVQSLRYYVDYSESGDSLLNPEVLHTIKPLEQQEEVVVKMDTVNVPEHHLSINPFSPFLLGINFDYMYRIGYEKKFAIHVPFRYFTLFGNESLIHSGVGFNYIPYNTERFSMYMGMSSQFFHLNRKTVVGFPITVGFVVSLNKLLTINGYAGAGPFLGNPEMWELPLVADVHLGLGFKFGELYKTTNKSRID
jgi:hypothetical protein